MRHAAAIGITASLISTIPFIAVSSAAHAATRLVPLPYTTIQAAINAAAPGDTVLVLQGTYRGEGNRDVTFGGKDIVVRSSGGADVTILDCEGSSAAPHRGFLFVNDEPATALLSGFTIEGGYHPGRLEEGGGGGVYCKGATSPTIVDCHFISNESGSWGGGLMALWSASPVVLRCTFTHNIAAAGGAVGCSRFASVVLTDCVFEENQSSSYGGAVFAAESAATLSDCTLVRNVAGTGGGIYTFNVYAEILRCAFIGNVASGGPGGGAICVDWGVTTDALDQSREEFLIRQCTLHGNRATFGSGVFAYNHLPYFPPPRVEATIISGGVTGAAAEGDLDTACSDIWGNAGGDWVGNIAGHLGVDGNFTADPEYCDAPRDNLMLTDTSPCLPGQHPEGYDCGLIGAFGEGCGTTPTEARTWGAVKSLFR